MPEVMEESQVQWLLLKDQEYFAKILNLPLRRCLGTEVTTKYGRVDFMFQLKDNNLLVVELETGINSTSKLEHCTSQITRYKKLKDPSQSQGVKIALVFAYDITPERFRNQLQEFTSEIGVILRSYSIQRILRHYNKMVNQLNYTSGVSLGRAVALGITSITWIKKFMLPFLIIDNHSNNNGLQTPLDTITVKHSSHTTGYFNTFELRPVDHLPWDFLKQSFSSNTNFYVLKRLVEDLELIQIMHINKKRQIILTDYGERFRDDMYTHLQFQDGTNVTESSKDLTLTQKRILLEILLNGNLTKIKVNIFYFLRFVHLTEGIALPKQSAKLTKAEQQYFNHLFKSSYNSRTLKDLILQTCTFCTELGLIEKISAKDQLYDGVIFTTLGSRVYNYFENLLHVERERHQIPLQVKSDD